MLLSAGGDRTEPISMCFDKEAGLVTGSAARNMEIMRPADTVSHLRLFAGRTMEHPTIRNRSMRHRIKVGPGPDQSVVVHAAGRAYAPEQLLGALIKRINEGATEQLADAIGGAILIAPMGTTEAERQALQKGLELGGIPCIAVMDELEAATESLRDDGATGLALVIHFGGATCRAATVDLANPSTALAFAADEMLGGDDITQRVADLLLAEVEAEDRIDLRTIPAAHARLWQAAEKLKEDLSGSSQAQVKLPFIADGPRGPIHVQRTVDQETLEGLCADLFARVVALARKPLKAISRARADHLVLLGGAIRTPIVQRKLRTLATNQPTKPSNPDETAALHAATRASEGAEGDSLTLHHVLTRTIGIATADRMVPVIRQGAQVPATAQIVLEPSTLRAAGGFALVGGDDMHPSQNALLGLMKQPASEQDGSGTVQVQVEVDGQILVSWSDANGALIGRATGQDADLVYTRTEREQTEDGPEVEAARARLEEVLVALEATKRTSYVSKQIGDAMEAALRHGRLALGKAGLEGLEAALERAMEIGRQAEAEQQQG